MSMVKGMGGMINSLYKKALSAILRSAFGVMVVMNFIFVQFPDLLGLSYLNLH